MNRCIALSIALVLALAGCADYAKHAVSLYDAGDYAGAARAADEGLVQHPGNAGLWGMKIRASLAQGDADGVAKAYASYEGTADELDRQLLDDLVVATLGQALASPSPKLKIAAILAVEDVELQPLADDVAQRMNDDDERVAATASIAIFHGGYGAAGPNAGAMLASEDPEVRRIVVDGIGKKVGALALADLEKAATDKDAHVRASAIRWLGQLKDKDAVEVCTRHLHDPDPAVRAASARALAHIGIGRMDPIAKTALADKDLEVRIAGIDVLVASKLADAELVALTEDPDPRLAIQAAIAVRQTHPELGAKVVARGIASDDWTTRAGIANQLVAAVGKQAALPIARRLTTDKELKVRLAAARVLAHAGDREGAVAVYSAALTGNDDVTQPAADLAELADPRGLELLSKLVRDPARTAEQRQEAAFAHRNAHRVTPGLVAALADPSALVRVEAAHTIGMLAKKKK